ncbi:MAG: IclR family transcriptional regulator [Rhodobacteraceae bacterium]|nr:IclR family transcriptional regulator [Paracoccaceae bacterium]
MPFTHTERSLRALELLVENPAGLALARIAEALEMPKSGAHRLMAELVRMGYAAQDAGANYHLTPRLVSLAFRHLGALGTVDAAQPVLEALAAQSGELVRLSVTDGNRQVWVAKAQGARSGLIYDPQMGDAAHLASMATGLAWLATLPQANALALVAEQGLAAPGLGPNAPRTLDDVEQRLAEARACGHALVIDSSAPGMSAIAAPILHPASGTCLGTVSIGGPSTRLTPDRLAALAPALRDAARALSDRVAGSTYFTAPRQP